MIVLTGTWGFKIWLSWMVNEPQASVCFHFPRTRVMRTHQHTTLKKKVFIYFHLGVCAYIYEFMRTAFVKYPWRPQEGTRCHGTGVTDGCALPCGCREPNLGTLWEQAVPRSRVPLLTSRIFKTDFYPPRILKCPNVLTAEPFHKHTHLFMWTFGN